MEKKFKWLILLIIVFSICIIGLSIIQLNDSNQNNYALAPIIVYKTNGDYYNNIFMRGLPDPTEPIPYPIRLSNDYLLGEGILEYGASRAYVLDFNHDTYSEITHSEFIDENFFNDHILDRHPFTELYDCTIPHQECIIELSNNGLCDLENPADSIICELNYFINNNKLKFCCKNIL